MKKLILALLLTPTLSFSQGQTSMTGDEFRALSEGYTLHFEDMTGEYFGSEQYFPDGRTLWKPRNGECERGVWAEDRGRICFLHYGEVDCWRIYGENGDVAAAETADPDDAFLRLRIVRKDRSPVLCPDGPGV